MAIHAQENSAPNPFTAHCLVHCKTHIEPYANACVVELQLITKNLAHGDVSRAKPCVCAAYLMEGRHAS